LSISDCLRANLQSEITNLQSSHGNGGTKSSVGGAFAQAGAPPGGQIRGKTMATDVLAEGSDNYQVIFSSEELDADFQNSEVLVADTVDGAPLADKIGPLRLVVPQDKRPARWVRMLRSIQVVKVSK
jgi:hypothetical protein